MNPVQDQYIVRRLRLSGILIIVGLIVEALSLAWNHPLSFIAFISIGGLAIGLGVIIFLMALVSSRAQP